MPYGSMLALLFCFSFLWYIGKSLCDDRSRNTCVLSGGIRQRNAHLSDYY